MPVDVVLHIGRAKTGTSSLQRFLATNRSRLLDQGVLYPFTGRSASNHGEMVRTWRKARAEGASEADVAAWRELKQDLAAEVASHDGRVLISSEGFQNLKPHRVAAIFRNYNVKVIVYIREPIAYLISAYQQRIQASGYRDSFETYAGDHLVDNESFLGGWAKAFGRENVVARPYLRSAFPAGDVIDDFCRTAGIDAMGLARPKQDQNPSIGGAVLEFKRIVNHARPRSHFDPAVYQTLSALAAQRQDFRLRPVVGRAQHRRLAETYAEPNRRLSLAYLAGEDVFQPPAVPDSDGRTVTPDELAEVMDLLAGRDAELGHIFSRSIVALAEHAAREKDLSSFQPLAAGDPRLAQPVPMPGAAHFEVILAACKGGNRYLLAVPDSSV